MGVELTCDNSLIANKYVCILECILCVYLCELAYALLQTKYYHGKVKAYFVYWIGGAKLF